VSSGIRPEYPNVVRRVARHADRLRQLPDVALSGDGIVGRVVAEIGQPAVRKALVGAEPLPADLDDVLRVDRVVQRPAADTVPRLEDDDVNALGVEVMRSADPCKAGSDHDDLGAARAVRR
jgi:hypothetical protein